MKTRVQDQPITLHQVSADNWQDVVKLSVSPGSNAFVADPCYYLALCTYGGIWNPLVICLGDQVIGFMMWAFDTEENSCWLGGFIIDQNHQRQGYGRRALQAAVDLLSKQHGYGHFALSYQPNNTPAKNLYASFGFSETDEWAENEQVARYRKSPQNSET